MGEADPVHHLEANLEFKSCKGWETLGGFLNLSSVSSL
jgi:hypothetical protein